MRIFALLFVTSSLGFAQSQTDKAIDLLAPRLAKASPSPASPVQVSPRSPSGSTTGKPLSYDRLARDNIRVTAYAEKSGSKNTFNWSTYYGGYHKRVDQVKRLVVELSAIGNSPSPVTVEFFRVLRVNSKEAFVKGVAEQSDIGSGRWIVHLEATHGVTHYAYSGVTYRHGERMVGWMVRVIRDGRIVGFAAGPSTYERFAESAELVGQ